MSPQPGAPARMPESGRGAGPREEFGSPAGANRPVAHEKADHPPFENARPQEKHEGSPKPIVAPARGPQPNDKKAMPNEARKPATQDQKGHGAKQEKRPQHEREGAVEK